MRVPPPKPARSPQAEEPPPFWGTWRRVYLGVILWLVLLILVFLLFARTFSS